MRREIGNVARRRGPRTSHFPFLTRQRYSSWKKAGWQQGMRTSKGGERLILEMEERWQLWHDLDEGEWEK